MRIHTDSHHWRVQGQSLGTNERARTYNGGWRQSPNGVQEHSPSLGDRAKPHEAERRFELSQPRLGFKTCLSKTKTKTQQFQDQDQDQDFDDQDQDRDRDSRLTRPILEVHDWDMNCDKQKVMASRKSSIPVVAHSKQKTSYYV